MRLFLIVLAAGSSVFARVMNPDPAHHTRLARTEPSDIVLPPTEKRPTLPAVLPEYKAEIFQCGMGPEMDGYCCETLTKDGVGLGCK